MGGGSGYAFSDVQSGIQSLITTITGQFTIANIAAILGIVLAAIVGLFLFWWGARWVVKRITGAFRSGKLRL
jgi:hypothetical protein